ncbi:MAG: glycerol-3-phosphate dehydrogenase [Alphaproteobacteria bacterium]
MVRPVASVEIGLRIRALREGLQGVTGGEPIDLLIVGGGINGAGIARDAAGRGLSVVMCEQNDLASATSSASTKLIHGGLRYLETYEFRLVREALIEREVLLRAAPHIIWPLSFVLPHNKGLRPAWMVRLGLFLYDHLAKRGRLPGSYGIDLRSDPVGAPLKPNFTKAFCYSDCWVEDARLVVLNAIDAAERGAEILPRTRLTAARREGGLWQATLEPSNPGGATRRIAARALVNAAGPWVLDVQNKVPGAKKGSGLRLVKGSHIVVPRMSAGEQAYIFQNPDRRIIFAIPYERDFTLIGTTDLPYEGDPGAIAISDQETTYLCTAVSRYFVEPVVPGDVVWSYSGVRPLYDDLRENVSTVTRDYVFDIDLGTGADTGADAANAAPLLSIFGGKITTYRRLAEHALDKLLPRIETGRPGRPGRPAWTERATLPGGDLPGADFAAFLAEFRAARPWLPEALARRLARAYGTRVEVLLGSARGLADLGEDLGGGLHEAEADYLIDREWASKAEDILWRRSKLGLHLPQDGPQGGATRLDDWIAQRH